MRGSQCLAMNSALHLSLMQGYTSDLYIATGLCISNFYNVPCLRKTILLADDCLIITTIHYWIVIEMPIKNTF